MLLPVSPESLVHRFDMPFARAIVLMGSFARGEAGPYSDIDLVRFTDGTKPPESRSFLIDGHLVVVSDVPPADVDSWFTEPELASRTIIGVRRALAFLDRERYFAQIQSRAETFQWDHAMQVRANRWASAALVGWIEEVHKGLAGLQSHDSGRLLNARHGLSWGLSQVMQVQRGVLIAGENEFYEAITRAMAPQPAWIQLYRTAFGIESEEGDAPTLREQVRAGLQLYILTAELLGPALQAEDKPLIAQTVDRIRTALA